MFKKNIFKNNNIVVTGETINVSGGAVME